MSDSQIEMLKTVQVSSKKSKSALIRKIIFIPLSLCCLVISVFMILTIIGILPGIGLGMIGILLFFLSFDYYTVSCPHCDKKQTLMKIVNRDDFTCRLCKKPVKVEWTKEG